MGINKLNNFFKKNMYNTINNYGQIFSIYTTTQTSCPTSLWPTGGCKWDEINKESTRSNCSTCEGKYYTETVAIKQIKGIIKDFVTASRGYWDNAQNKYESFPVGDARITCLLDDILIDHASATGVTIVDNAQKIVANGTNYKHHSIIKKGIKDLYVALITLKKI